MSGADWSPSLEIVDLRVPADHLEAPPARRRLAGRVAAGHVAVAVAFLLAGVLVGSRLQMTDGAGVAFALPVSAGPGNVVEFPGGVGTVLSTGPATVTVAPGRLLVDEVQRGGVLPTNSLVGAVGAEDALVIDTTGRIHVVARGELHPIHPLVSPPGLAELGSPSLAAD